MDKNHSLGWGTLKLLVGTLGVGLIIWKTPILEILAVFAYFVLLPVAFLASFGLIGSGTLETIQVMTNGGLSNLGERVKHYREELKRDEPDPDPEMN